MPYCPDCRLIYRHGTEVCPDCQVELVEEDAETEHDLAEPEEEEHSVGLADAIFGRPDVDHVDLVSIYNAPDELIADIIQGVLTSEGIRALIHSEEAPVFEGVLTPFADHWGEILVPRTEEARAREVLDAYLSAQESETVGEDGGSEEEGDTGEEVGSERE